MDDAPAAAPLAWRTRLLGVLLGAIAKEPPDADAMVALRERRRALLASRAGRLVMGATHPEVDVRSLRVDIAGREANVRVDVPRTPGPHPVVVNFHGGGWCIGSPEQSRWVSSRVAHELGALVISPDYRLAPEHPYPAAVEDAWAALEWACTYAAERGGDPERVAVMGESAGGNLASVVALLARDADGPPLRAQVLIYPAVEMHETWPSELEFANAMVLSQEMMHRFTDFYLAEDPTTTDWQASPIRAHSHADLPPTLIVTAGHDPIRDHGAKYADTLRTAGVDATLHNHPRAVHGFMALPGGVPSAKDALAQIVAFLRDAL